MKLWIKKGNYGWSTIAKNKDDKEMVGYVDISFKNGNEPKENSEIKISDGFFTCYKNKAGEVKTQLKVMDYEVLRVSEYAKAEQEEKKEDIYADFGSNIVLDDNENNSLPF